MACDILTLFQILHTCQQHFEISLALFLQCDNNSNSNSDLYFHTKMFKAEQLVGSYTNQIKSQQNKFKCWFLVRGENRRTRGKTSWYRVENQQTNSIHSSLESSLKTKEQEKYARSRETQNTRERGGAEKFYLRIYFSRFYTLSEIKGYSSFKSSFQIWQKNCWSQLMTLPNFLSLLFEEREIIEN